jgi:hypothetical protein
MRKEKEGRIHTQFFPLIALALIPIIIFPKTADPFNLPKSLALLVIAAGGVTHLFLSNKQSLIGKVNYLFFALAAFMAVAGLLSDTTLPRLLFGLPGRSNGLIYYLSLLLLVFVAKNCIVSSGFEKRLSAALQFSFLLNMTYAFLQFQGKDPIPWANPYNPIIGFFGNPNFSASFLATSAIFYVWMSYRARGASRLAPLVLAAISLSLSFLTESIQGILLFVIAVGVSVLALLFKKSKSIAVTLTSISVFFGTFIFFGLLGYGPLGMLREYTFALRLQYWIIAIKSALSSPWIGLGPDSYVEGFREFRSMYLVKTYSVELVADSGHSVPLNFAANFGIPAFLIYVSLLILITVVGIRVTLSRAGKFDLYSVLTLLWLSLLIQSLISIEQIGLSSAQMIIGGFLLNRSWISSESKNKQERNDKQAAMLNRRVTSSHAITEYRGELSFLSIAVAFILIFPILREDIALNEIKGASVDSSISDEKLMEQYSRFSFYTKDEWNRGVWLYNFLLNAKRVEASNELLVQIISKDRSASEALDQLAKVYRAENRPADAKRAYLRILELDPLNAKAKLGLAEVEKQLGNSFAYKKILGDIARDLPNTTWAETALKMLNES